MRGDLFSVPPLFDFCFCLVCVKEREIEMVRKNEMAMKMEITREIEMGSERNRYTAMWIKLGALKIKQITICGFVCGSDCIAYSRWIICCAYTVYWRV
jgi:hypothetical protein